MTSNPDRFREWDAAYVLGALSAEDRHDFERHLSTCPACSAAVAELAGLPGILSALPVAEAVAIAESDPAGRTGADATAAASTASTTASDERLRTALHQPGLVQRLAGRAVRRTRQKRIRLTVALTIAAAVIALGGGLLGAGLAAAPAPEAGVAAPPATGTTPATGSGTAAQVVAMEPLVPDALTAAVTITDTDWGTRFDWSCVYLNQLWKDNGPQDYDMVMTDRNGTVTVLATWTATSPTTENLAASTDLSSDQIQSIEIRASRSGTPLAHTDL